MTASQRPARGLVPALLALGLTALTACGDGPEGRHRAPSADRARELIRTALDAWKGGTAGSLARGDSPLRFVDPDLERKASLTSYQIAEGQDQPFGPVVDVPVTLRLKGKKGGEREVRAVYQVALEPSPAVLRNDPD